MTETIAMLGTGTMGAPMARNLMRAGFAVRAWNRTRSKAADLEPDGATVADSPADATRGASILLTMLYNEDSVAVAVRGCLEQLGPDGLWLQMTTVGPAGAQRLGALADRAGVTMVDAPVLGTKAPATSGDLTVVAAGPGPVRDRSAAVFDAVGNRTIWIDAPQGGQRLKLVANSWVLTATEAVAEALRLASGLGVDPGLFIEAISGTANDLPYAHVKAKAMQSGDYTASFAVDNALKDAELILRAARDVGVDVSLTGVVRRQLQQASDDGHGHLDLSAVALVQP